ASASRSGAGTARCDLASAGRGSARIARAVAAVAALVQPMQNAVRLAVNPIAQLHQGTATRLVAHGLASRFNAAARPGERRSARIARGDLAATRGIVSRSAGDLTSTARVGGVAGVTASAVASATLQSQHPIQQSPTKAR